MGSPMLGTYVTSMFLKTSLSSFSSPPLHSHSRLRRGPGVSKGEKKCSIAEGEDQMDSFPWMREWRDLPPGRDGEDGVSP